VALVFGVPAVIGLSVIRVVKLLQGRKIDQHQQTDDGTVILVHGENRLEIPDKTFRVFQQEGSLGALRGLVEPLKTDGVDRLMIRSNEAGAEDQETVTKEEREYFDRDLPTEDIGEDTFRATYLIVAPVFRSGIKWRLHDGTRELTVTMRDDHFIRRVEEGRVAFRNGDTLVCDVRMKQEKVGRKLRTEYIVQHVVDYETGDRQMELL
jgi:hypothetical protein